LLKGNKMKPFIKWVGGKSRLLTELTPMFPDYDTLYEPFVGGGAVLFNQKDKPAVVNDFNWQLMMTYQVVKSQPEELISLLERMSPEKEDFLEVRKRTPVEPLQVASRFIYLNKVGFNGMWRENSYGKYNVPHGSGKSGKTLGALVSFQGIRDASIRLQNVEFTAGDFSQCLVGVSSNDFVFLDPPYVDTWDNYTSGGFSEASHKRIVKELTILSENNVKFLLTNSYNDVTKKLYKGFNQTTVEVAYVLGGKNASREKRQEIVVTNY